jgi:pimeloyl-ACP methyl ester carboxylesterase
MGAAIAEVNGTRLHYDARGTGPALLFLHGFTLDRRMWRRQVEALSARFRVVSYDARGFGRSAMPGAEPYRHCDDAAALCEHLGIDRVVAVGHSIGAHQTLELALTRPGLVAGWVSVCAAGLASIPFPGDITTMFGAIRASAREQSVDAAKAIWAACGWFASAREAPAIAAELDEMLADYSGWHWTHDNPAKNIDPPAAERLADLRAPALVVTGARDLPYNDAVADALVARIANASALRLPRAGHMANMEAPDEVTSAIADFAMRALAS